MRCNREAVMRWLRLVAVVAVSAVGAAGCNASQQALPSTDPSAANEIGLVRSGLDASGSADTWTTFAHDYSRSGLNTKVTSITRSTVSKLQLRWKHNVGVEIFASPVAYAGNLIIVTQGSPATVYDLDTSDGRVLWKYSMGGGSRGQMTPTIDPDAGLVIAGAIHPNQKYSDVFALRLLDGSLAWHQRVFGRLRAAPVVAGGQVYVGRAGGDPPLCLQGGITALNESTGKVDWNWNVNSVPDEGGSVWGAIAYDGSHLIFGTGNICEGTLPTANGIVALNLEGKVVWNTVAVKDSHYDLDTGGGVMLVGGLAHAINKNGELYALHQQTGKIAWTTDLNSYATVSGNGGFTTPTTDGTTILEGSGYYKNDGSAIGREFCMLMAAKPTEVLSGYHSELEGLSMAGHVQWSRTMANQLVGYVAVADGVGFAGLNEDFVAVDSKSGATLWSYPTPAYINASMIVVPSGVYGADNDGNVYAFALPSKK